VTEDDDPWSGIVHLANRLGSDAVCMANHARSGIGETFLKSTTREVLRQIRVPVLIVHPATTD
jgi:nucleotide-binding universal stress UspA family protein